MISVGKRMSYCLVVGSIMTVAATSCGAVSGSAETASESATSTTLVLADGFSPTHPVGIAGSQPFIEYVEEHGSAVGLELDVYSAGALGSPGQIPTLLKGGVIDMGYVIPANVAEELPLATVANLPGLTEDSCLASEALLPMMQPGGEVYENELKHHGFLAIWGQGMPQMELMTADHHIESPADAAGLMIASNGGQTDRVLQGLGIAPVSMEASDYYEGVARNVVDGVMTAKYATVTYGLEDEIGHSTLGANLGVSTIYMSINTDAWNALTPEQQQVLEDAGKISQQQVCEGFRTADEEAVVTFQESGVEFGEVESDNRSEWDAVLSSIRDQWANAAESQDIPARKTLEAFQERLSDLEQR